jgi:AcrR family transcriptional regulator
MIEQATTRKDQIYQVAERLFSERGYHATTIRDIARELQIEGGSLYSHINSKQELLYEIVLRGSERFMQGARKAIAGGGGAREQLRRLMRQHLTLTAESLDASVVYFHEWHHLDAAQQEVIKARRDEYEGYVRQIIRQGVASGEFAPGDERMLALHVLSLLNWTYHWYNPEGRLSAGELADLFYQQLLYGLEPRGGTP